MIVDENPMTEADAFDLVLTGRAGPLHDPRSDPKIGSRAHRRASHPLRRPPRAANR